MFEPWSGSLCCGLGQDTFILSVSLHVVINRVVMGRAQFMFYTGFIFLVLLLTRCRPLHGQVVVRTLNHATFIVDSPKAVETLIHRKCYGYCFLHDAYNKFSFGFIKAFDSKGMLNTLKKKLCQPWNALAEQFSLSLHDK